MNSLHELVATTNTRLAMPIAVFPGIALAGGTVHEVVTNSAVQFAASVAIHERYQTPVVLSAMDLSAEAEAFGCTIAFSPEEIPTVTGSLITDLDSAKRLGIPKPGDGRTHIYLEVVQALAKLPKQPLVLAGCIGPFSLAARLVGVSEAMTLTLTDPDLMHLLLEKSAEFLSSYIQAFQKAGASGVLMAEPAAGLLSPKGMMEFSSHYIRRIVAETTRVSQFSLILHNCAAKLLHLPAVLESGAKMFHFGAPMDILAALQQVPEDVILLGNLDPTAMFVQSTPEQLAATIEKKLAETETFRRYIISSGCDVPARAPLANLDAFFDTVKRKGGKQ